MNRTKDAVAMLERCLMLNNGYTAAYLLLAKLHTGSQTGRLLKHVAAYQPKHPEHQARYARWLRDNGKHTFLYHTINCACMFYNNWSNIKRSC